MVDFFEDFLTLLNPGTFLFTGKHSYTPEDSMVYREPGQATLDTKRVTLKISSLPEGLILVILGV